MALTAFRIVSWTATLQSWLRMPPSMLLVHLWQYICGGSCQAVQATSEGNCGNQGFAGYVRTMTRTVWFDCSILCNLAKPAKEFKTHTIGRETLSSPVMRCLVLYSWAREPFSHVRENHIWLFIGKKVQPCLAKFFLYLLFHLRGKCYSHGHKCCPNSASATSLCWTGGMLWPRFHLCSQSILYVWLCNCKFSSAQTHKQTFGGLLAS